MGIVEFCDLLSQLSGIFSRLQLRKGLACECLEGISLPAIEASRDPVEYAECAQGRSFGADQRHARVEADVRVRNHPGVIRETLIKKSVGNLENAALENGMGAKGRLPRRLPDLQPCPGLEPLPRPINHGDQ